MLRSMVKVAAAVAAFGLLHSALASRAAKQTAEDVLGQRNRNGLYRMTTKLLAFNTAATAYLVIGSWHEEVRLRQAYGQRYEVYRCSGIPFYSPRPARSLSSPMQDVKASQRVET